MGAAKKLDPHADHERLTAKAKDEWRVKVGLPTFDRMLVQRLSAGEETKGGIILPPTAQRSAQRGRPINGRVVAKGPGKLLPDGMVSDVFAMHDIEVGSIVTWHEFGGTCIDKEKDLHVVSIDDVVYVEGPGDDDNADPGDEADEDPEDEPELPEDDEE